MEAVKFERSGLNSIKQRHVDAKLVASKVGVSETKGATTPLRQAAEGPGGCSGLRLLGVRHEGKFSVK